MSNRLLVTPAHSGCGRTLLSRAATLVRLGPGPRGVAALPVPSANRRADGHMLKDIGVSFAEAEAEANKPFWQE